MRTPNIKKEQIQNPNEPEAQQKWYVIDAEGKPLGRVASKAATMLMGKHKPTFTPHVDMGDFIIVINAAKVKLTGRKLEQKKYYRHSQWPGGLKVTSVKDLLQKKPSEVMRFAVKGMLPKGRLGKDMLGKLKVYADSEHPHQAQKPQVLTD